MELYVDHGRFANSGPIDVYQIASPSVQLTFARPIFWASKKTKNAFTPHYLGEGKCTFAELGFAPSGDTE